MEYILIIFIWQVISFGRDWNVILTNLYKVIKDEPYMAQLLDQYNSFKCMRTV